MPPICTGSSPDNLESFSRKNSGSTVPTQDPVPPSGAASGTIGGSMTASATTSMRGGVASRVARDRRSAASTRVAPSPRLPASRRCRRRRGCPRRSWSARRSRPDRRTPLGTLHRSWARRRRWPRRGRACLRRRGSVSGASSPPHAEPAIINTSRGARRIDFVIATPRGWRESCSSFLRARAPRMENCHEERVRATPWNLQLRTQTKDPLRYAIIGKLHANGPMALPRPTSRGGH